MGTIIGLPEENRDMLFSYLNNKQKTKPAIIKYNILIHTMRFKYAQQ